MSRTLDRTLAFLLDNPKVSKREVRSVYLNSFYTVVELDDTSIGAVPSAYTLPPETLTERQSAIHSRLEGDPLLLDFTEREVRDPVAKCIRAAVINALSTPLIRKDDDPSFTVQTELPKAFFDEIRYAVLVGFGGFLEHLVRWTKVPRIHIVETSYRQRRRALDKSLGRLRKIRSGVEISISDGSDLNAHLKLADFVSMSGLTLTSDEFDSLLVATRECKCVVVQGQGAGIYPKELFAAGVDLLATTVKTREVAKTAFWDSTGKSVRSLLEHNLPYIFLCPRSANNEAG